MKNIEKYEQEISKLVNKGKSLSCAIAIAAGISNGNCFGCKCSDCHKKCLEWMHSEYNEPILSDDEKDIIKYMINVIHKFGCEVIYAIKYAGINGKTYILLNYENSLTKYIDSMATPWFKNDKFKGMIPDKEYTLEELGISCPTQKDS